LEKNEGVRIRPVDVVIECGVDVGFGPRLSGRDADRQVVRDDGSARSWGAGERRRGAR